MNAKPKYPPEASGGYNKTNTTVHSNISVLDNGRMTLLLFGNFSNFTVFYTGFFF